MDPFTPLRQQYLTQPREVSIETLALCNAACVFCPYPSLERQGAKLPIEVMGKMIREMSSWTEPFFFSPFKVNEPLLDVRLQNICEHFEAGCPQGRLRLFTNGAPLTSAHVGWIAKLTRLEHLWISLNSCEAHEYEELMKIPYEKTAKRLDYLHAAVENKAFPHPVIVSRVSQYEADSGPWAAGVCGSASDAKFVTMVAQRWPRFQAFVIKRDGWLGFVDPSSSSIPRSPCARWFELSITAQGKAVLCCMDGKGEFVQGDVNTQTLTEIYNNPFLLNLRQRALTRHGVNPCERCTY